MATKRRGDEEKERSGDQECDERVDVDIHEAFGNKKRETTSPNLPLRRKGKSSPNQRGMKIGGGSSRNEKELLAVDEMVVLFAETGGLPRLKGVWMRSEGYIIRGETTSPNLPLERKGKTHLSYVGGLIRERGNLKNVYNRWRMGNFITHVMEEIYTYDWLQSALFSGPYGRGAPVGTGQTCLPAGREQSAESTGQRTRSEKPGTRSRVRPAIRFYRAQSTGYGAECIEQRARSPEHGAQGRPACRQAGSKERGAKSRVHGAESDRLYAFWQRAEGRGQRAKSIEHRAQGIEQRDKSKDQGARSRNEIRYLWLSGREPTTGVSLDSKGQRAQGTAQGASSRTETRYLWLSGREPTTGVRLDRSWPEWEWYGRGQRKLKINRNYEWYNMTSFFTCGSNAVMSSTMTGLKSGTYMGQLEFESSGGINYGFPIKNEINRSCNSHCVREPACLPVGKSAIGACGEPLGAGEVPLGAGQVPLGTGEVPDSVNKAQSIGHRAKSEEPELEASGGIDNGLRSGNKINSSYNTSYVSDLSAFGACGEPDSVEEQRAKSSEIVAGACRFVTDTGTYGIATVPVVPHTGNVVTDKRYQKYQMPGMEGGLRRKEKATGRLDEGETKRGSD